MMTMVGRVVVVVVVVMLSLPSAVMTDAKYMFNCKFSNEGCESDKECCSGNCVQAHPGTNQRCTRSSLHKACLYTYQCEERLTCGPANACCSKYWGTCRNDDDCCFRDLRCLEAEGFYYKRCLMGSVDSSAEGLIGGKRLSAAFEVLVDPGLVRMAVLNHHHTFLSLIYDLLIPAWEAAFRYL
ncbi:uncharacterized protein LOC143275501 [Babylonia areolata]|uniref:uncharacterized protein LOC143275501 n=1 Tax=Babylonia areolata TaxID=304850 RepID=UPI003FD25C73